MAIISVARFALDGARFQQAVENVKVAKKVFMANGAEHVFWGNILAGVHPGEWVLMIHYPNLATMEKAFAAAMGDADFAKRFLDPDPPLKLTGRSIITLTDV